MSAQTINVDEAGLRTTPGANCSEDAYQVWVLGGSTVWGFGSPDWGTIPAYLQQTLDEQRNGPVCVLNLGENAFVMTQNVIELEERLKDGQVPDVAIFYNGFNETFTAYETGDPERTFFNSNFTNLFVRDGLFSTDAFDLVAERSYTFALLKEWVDSQPTEEAPNSYQVQGIATRTMAAAILESYFANVEMVQALGEAYNFRVYFFWQPVLLAHDKPGTPVERATLASEATPAMAELFTETYRQMVSQDRADFYSLGAVFDDVTEGLYFDLVHVTPVGNALIAAAMLEVIE
jgi:lysophospholipase L1-like esterase